MGHVIFMYHHIFKEFPAQYFSVLNIPADCKASIVIIRMISKFMFLNSKMTLISFWKLKQEPHLETNLYVYHINYFSYCLLLMNPC